MRKSWTIQNCPAFTHLNDFSDFTFNKNLSADIFTFSIISHSSKNIKNLNYTNKFIKFVKV